VSDQRGVATVIGLCMASVLMTIGLAAAWVGGTVVQHRAAQSAADLSALAGARAVQRGESGCAAAAAIAVANAATLSRCDVIGDHVWVDVEVPGPALLGKVPRLGGRAHAGPQP
jgi:secretion/DNA translocation related TadE-like protein